MKFDTPATTNPIDQLRAVGKPHDRIEGQLKVTGTAPYAYERHDVAHGQAYSYIIGAGIAKGRITSIDLQEAKAARGVIAILTAENAGELGQGEFYSARPLAGPDVQHYHQAVAIVVAETFEQARAAAHAIRIEYERSDGMFDLAAVRDRGVMPQNRPDTGVGDFARAFAAAPVKVDETFTTPDQAHVMMEPHAAVAAWEGERLTLWCTVQLISWAMRDLSKTLGISPDRIRLVSSYVGGGFGGKASVLADAVLAAAAAKVTARPVKVALQRSLLFNNTTHRPATIQRLRIGARIDGQITAIGHESWSGNLVGGPCESATIPTKLLYAGTDRLTALRLAHLDLPEGNAMRAPGEAPGMMALEIAMDELAEKLGMDPVEVRIINDTQVDPEKPERPFSTRKLVECLRIGADHFGWSRRDSRPGSIRDGRWLVGMGMASAIRGAPVGPSGAGVRLDEKGIVTVETDMTDIGTGSYTIIGQTAAEMMGVTLDRVVVRLADSNFPRSTGSAGQRGANSSTAGVYAACVKLRELVARRLGFNEPDVEFTAGEVLAGTRRLALEQAAAGGDLVAEDAIEFVGLAQRYAQETFGAHFVEAGVDAATGEVRLRRMLAVCAAGRILNPKTARSQIIGGMTMGIGAALMEELTIDTRFGFFVNHDMASYEVPVHADVPHQEVIFLDETDPTMSPMKAKGVGELGISGAAAAVANAIYNATGVRVRDYPITLDKFLNGLPQVT